MSYQGQLDIDKATISRGIFILTDTYAIEIGYPAYEPDTADTVSDPLLKHKARPYADTNSLTEIIGVSLDTISAKPGAAVDQILKPDWIRRDLGVVVEGEFKMLNMESGFTAQVGTKLAPYPSGFVQYVSGMVLMAEAQETIPYQKRGRVLIKRGMNR